VLTRLPFLGVGLGYRSDLDTQIWLHQSSIDWLEVISEHYMARPQEKIDQALRLRGVFPLIPHGVEMSIGTAGELDPVYVDSLAELVSVIGAPWFSDHLCFTRAGGIALGQLTPLPRSRATAAEIARKARWLQERIGAPFLLENITYYIDIESPLSEAEFIVEVMERCECGLLLDLTNVFINGINHRFTALDFLESIPLERVVQIHLAGGEPSAGAFLDTHSSPVPDEVFGLLRYVVDRAPNLKAVLIERDSNYPDDFQELAHDLTVAREIVGVRPG
jgi:uncharacterized protein (UPF0276 family)